MDAVAHIDHAGRQEGATHSSGIVHVVVVSEYCYHPVGCAETLERSDASKGVVGRDGDEVAGNSDKVRLLPVDKVDYAIQTLRRHPAVHVDIAYVDHPVPVERECEPGQLKRHPLDVEPVRLNVPRVGQDTRAHEATTERRLQQVRSQGGALARPAGLAKAPPVDGSTHAVIL